MKLAWWPGERDDQSDSGKDIDWEWIKTLEKKRIGELRIDEPINGLDNIRVIFFKSDLILPEDPLRRIWLLTVLQKKRQDFSTVDIKSFRAMRDLIVARNYSGSDRA